MKTFKELVSGDNIFIISISQYQRLLSFKTVRYSLNVEDKTCPSQIMIFFKDPNVNAISVPPGAHQFKKESIDKNTSTYYFSDATSLDLFLKDCIEKERTFIKNLESCSIAAWSCERRRSVLEPGKIYFYSRFRTPCIASKDGDAYDCDGFKISKATIESGTMREATKDERIEFFDRLTRVLNARPNADTLIAGLETCGISWNPVIKEIVSIE
jgi:hypothetical protein